MSQWSGLRTIVRKHEVFEISASIKHNVYFMNNCLTKQSFLGDKIGCMVDDFCSNFTEFV